MELIFSEQNNRWVAEFEATADFNLHIEGVAEGNISIFQRGTTSGEYAYVRGGTPYPSLNATYDYDFSALIYPKFMRVTCATKPTMAVVTFAE